MKTIIAGSREINDYNSVCTAVTESKFAITEIVSGGANGVDSVGEVYGRLNSIPVKQFIPDWSTHGKKAGILRNIEMGNYADALIAVWDGKSKGTEHMIEYAKKRGLKVFVKIIP